MPPRAGARVATRAAGMAVRGVGRHVALQSRHGDFGVRLGDFEEAVVAFLFLAPGAGRGLEKQVQTSREATHRAMSFLRRSRFWRSMSWISCLGAGGQWTKPSGGRGGQAYLCSFIWGGERGSAEHNTTTGRKREAYAFPFLRKSQRHHSQGMPGERTEKAPLMPNAAMPTAAASCTHALVCFLRASSRDISPSATSLWRVSCASMLE